MGKQVNGSELAGILGVSVQTLATWRKDGMPVEKEGSGRAGNVYDTAKVIEWMVNRRTGRAAGGSGDADDHEVRLAKERADNLALKNAILRREYAPISVITMTVGAVAAQIGATLDSLPLNVRRKVPSLTITDVEVIKREVVKCQNIASKAADVLDRKLDELVRAEGAAE